MVFALDGDSTTTTLVMPVLGLPVVQKFDVRLFNSPWRVSSVPAKAGENWR